jgi:transcriptional regulator with XRE-family HTH domain
MNKEILRVLRKKKKKTCNQVAQALNISVRQYRRYERGERMIEVEHFFMLASFYGEKIETILYSALKTYELFRLKPNGQLLLEKRPKNNKRLYQVFRNMIQRCYNPNCPDFKDYGGRGITICDEWLYDFGAFWDWAMANGYDENAKYGECTIDRIDVNGKYEPSNCRWVSMMVQNWNRRSYKKNVN